MLIVGASSMLREMSKNVRFSIGNSFEIGQLVYMNGSYYGYASFTHNVPPPNTPYLLVFKRDNTFANGWNKVMKEVSQLPPSNPSADSLFDISGDGSFVALAGVVLPSASYVGYIIVAGKYNVNRCFVLT